jgi:hypothetical protein
MLTGQVLTKPGVVAKKSRANGTGEGSLFSVLFDVDLKFEVVQEDEIAEAADAATLIPREMLSDEL